MTFNKERFVYSEISECTTNQDFVFKKLKPTEEGSGGKVFLKSQLDTENLVYYPRASNKNPYTQKNNAVGPINYLNIRDLLAQFFMRVYYHYGDVPNWREYCIGITSLYGKHSHWSRFDNQSDISHMPFFDYDGKNVKKVIRKDVRNLQKTYNLGNAWVYETKRGFHVYFFCNKVPYADYEKMLKDVNCCKGFKKTSLKQKYGVLRVSAKYTEFDISFLYVLRSKKNSSGKMTRKAHVIKSLLELGQQCETHFASLYPQWAPFLEDLKTWKPNKSGGNKPAKNNPSDPVKKIRKLKNIQFAEEYNNYKWTTIPNTQFNSTSTTLTNSTSTTVAYTGKYL